MARMKLGDVLGDDNEPPEKAATPPPPPPAVPPPADVKPRKFTMLVTSADDERARRVTDNVVRLAGIRPTKSMRADVVRALIAVADDDPELQQRVAARLHDGMAP